VLRASRQLLSSGGRIAFYTIHPTPGLSVRERRRAHRDGPVAVASPLTNRELLQRGGFVCIEETDRTDEFAVTAAAWIDQWDRHYDALADVLGADKVDERQRERRIQLRAVEDGLLRRSLLVAMNPVGEGEKVVIA
jgi:hypothetical protein